MQALGRDGREVIELQPGCRQHPIADITKLRQHTGWKPEIPFEQTITDTMNYWREQGTDS
jgi:nucleoside-diphosphate-sugar epimerase